MPAVMPNFLDPADPVAQSAAAPLSPDINFDGPIRLKEVTRQATRELERKIILNALQTHGSRRKAAKMQHISYRGLLYKIKEMGL